MMVSFAQMATTREAGATLIKVAPEQRGRFLARNLTTGAIVSHVSKHMRSLSMSTGTMRGERIRICPILS